MLQSAVTPIAPPAAPRSAARVRRWAGAALVAQFAFVGAWLLAAAWQGPHYSVVGHTISDMYAEGAPAAAFLIVVITLCGAAVLLFSRLSLWPALRAGGRAATVGSVLVATSIFGLGDLLTLFEREACRKADAGCGTSDQIANAGGALDATLSPLGIVSLIVAVFFLATAMRRVPGWSGWVRPTRGFGAVLIVLLVLNAAFGGTGLGGLCERLLATAGAAFLAALAVGVRRLTPKDA